MFFFKNFHSFFFSFFNFNIFLYDFFFNLSEIFFFILLLLFMLQISLRTRSLILSPQIKQLIPFLTLQKLKKILIFVFFSLLLNPFPWLIRKSLYYNFFIISPELMILKLIIIFFSYMILHLATFVTYVDKLNNHDFFFFFGYFILILLLFVQINDFFLLFLSFELLSLILYLLIVYYPKFTLNITPNFNLTKYQQVIYSFSLNIKNNLLNIHAGVIYFLFNAFFSGCFLLSLSFLFIYFKHTNFYLIFFFLTQFNLIQQSSIFVFCTIILLLGFFFFKFSAVPFHWWISAVFEGTSTLTLLFLIIPLKFVFFFVFIKLLFFFFSCFFLSTQKILIYIALLSMLFGTLGLISQLKLKKFWAYSTINHMGYLLLALSTFSFLGLRAFCIYLFSYFFLNYLFFILIQSLINQQFAQKFIFLNQISIFSNLTYHYLLIIFTILIFSLIGIPPLLGFWGKYLVISALWQTLNPFYLYLSLGVIIVTSLISTFCYLRLWITLFIKTKLQIKVFFLPIPIVNCSLLFFCCFIILFGGLFFIYFSQYLGFLDLFLFKLFFLC